LYSTLPSYEGKEEEVRTILNYPTRVIRPLTMQSLSIYDANFKEGVRYFLSDIEIAACQNIAYLPATMLDDFHDTVIVRYFAERDNWTENDILKMIKDEEKLKKIAEVQVPYIDTKTMKKIVPIHLVRGSFNLMNFYEKLLSELNLKALDIYLKRREEVWPYQSKDIAISALMRKGESESIIKLIGNGEKYISNLLQLPKKLAIIGEASASIVNEIVANESRKAETTPALCSFYGPITSFLQIGHDDIARIEEDMEEKTGNVVILSMLPSYQKINRKNLTRFLNEEPNLISQLLEPFVEKTYEGYKWLRELNFAVEDSRLAINMSIEIVKRDVKKFSRRFHLEPDLKWLKRAKELKEKYF
jgi:hypothetical protein